MEIELKRRLGGKEDLTFDTAGTNAVTTFTYDGENHELHAINATHVPVQLTTWNTISGSTGTVTSNVDNVLLSLDEKIQTTTAVMTADTSVTLEATESQTDIQNLIDDQPKNLGGHTLTFEFPAGTTTLTKCLDFENFYNGTLVVNYSATGTHPTIIYNSSAVYIRILHCTCDVDVSNFNITYCGSSTSVSSPYGIYVEGSPYVTMTGIEFTGKTFQESTSGNYDCYPCYFKGGDGEYSNCSFYNVLESSSESIYSGVGGEGGDRLTSVESGLGTVTLQVSTISTTVESLEKTVTGDSDKNYLVVWGKNTNGEFGSGGTASLGKQFLGYPLNCTDASFDLYNGIAIFNNKLYMTGKNTDSQLGSGVSARDSWTLQNDFGDWTDCEVCNGSCAAIRKKILYTWGKNGAGQLGQGDTAKTSLPKQVLTRSRGGTEANFTDDWREVEVGPGHMLAYAYSNASGSDVYGVYSCGNNTKGQLGQSNTSKTFLVPTIIGTFDSAPVLSLSAGGRVVDSAYYGLSACVYQDDTQIATGKLYTWGYGSDGALGVGASPSAVNTSPALINKVIVDGATISASTVWSKVSCGARHISAITGTGEVYTSGVKEALGLSTGSNAVMFTRIDFESGVLDVDDKIVDVKCGNNVTFLYSQKGKVYAYGKNTNYSFGWVAGSSTTYYPHPILLGTGANAVRSGCMCYGGGFISTEVQKTSGRVNDYSLDVAGCSTSAANGTYTPVDTTATGADRRWVKGTGDNAIYLGYVSAESLWKVYKGDDVYAYQTSTGLGEPTEGTWTDGSNTVTVVVHEEA